MKQNSRLCKVLCMDTILGNSTSWSPPLLTIGPPCSRSYCQLDRVSECRISSGVPCLLHNAQSRLGRSDTPRQCSLVTYHIHSASPCLHLFWSPVPRVLTLGTLERLASCLCQEIHQKDLFAQRIVDGGQAKPRPLLFLPPLYSLTTNASPCHIYSSP